MFLKQRNSSSLIFLSMIIWHPFYKSHALKEAVFATQPSWQAFIETKVVSLMNRFSQESLINKAFLSVDMII